MFVVLQFRHPRRIRAKRNETLKSPQIVKARFCVFCS